MGGGDRRSAPSRRDQKFNTKGMTEQDVNIYGGGGGN